jgi:hypothetical protein
MHFLTAASASWLVVAHLSTTQIERTRCTFAGVGLPRQPDGFEGRPLVVELPVAGDLAPADGEHRIVASAHASPARRAAPMLVGDDEDILAAIDEPLDLKSVLAPLLEPAFPRVAHCFVSVMDAPVGTLRVLNPFDVRCTGLGDQLW